MQNSGSRCEKLLLDLNLASDFGSFYEFSGEFSGKKGFWLGLLHRWKGENFFLCSRSFEFYRVKHFVFTRITPSQP